jgi:uncharacterized protein YndB with AHSA1/START domain
MTTDLVTTASVTIDAPSGAVWEALTTPALIKKWFFGVDTETDWSVGGSIIHRGEYQGKSYEDRGMILRFEPDHLLIHTHWSPMSGLADEPDNYQEVSWSLTARGGETQLTVDEANLPSEKAMAISDKGWQEALAALKKVVEGHASA